MINIHPNPSPIFVSHFSFFLKQTKIQSNQSVLISTFGLPFYTHTYSQTHTSTHLHTDTLKHTQRHQNINRHTETYTHTLQHSLQPYPNQFLCIHLDLDHALSPQFPLHVMLCCKHMNNQHKTTSLLNPKYKFTLCLFHVYFKISHLSTSALSYFRLCHVVS